MQPKIVLLYLCIINIVNNVHAQDSEGAEPPEKPAPDTSGSQQQSNEHTKRKPVPIQPPPQKLDDMLAAVNVKSSGVPKFNEYDAHFTSHYKMTCGAKVQAISSVEGNARCMPDENDIVEIMNDDTIVVQDCLRLIACKPGNNEELCETESIRMWLPYALKLVTATNVASTGNNFEVKKGEVLITLDPGCQITFNQEHHLRHRFQNKPEKIRDVLKNYPGFYLQPTFYHARRMYQGGNQLTFGGSLHKGLIEPLKSIDCNAGCDLGQLLYYKMPSNFYIFSLIFVDGAKCEWMRICLRGEQGIAGNNFLCDDADLLNVYIRNGFVTMPGAQNGAPIRLVKATKGTDMSDQMTTRPTQIGFDFDGERFSIWSVGRERVTSSTNVNHDGHIILYFSHHDCLIKKKGIKYLGENNGKVYQIDKDKSIDSVSTDKSSYITYATAKPRSTLGTIATASPTPNVSAVAPVTTTKKRNIALFIGTASEAFEFQSRTGWMIWMIFFGFFIGSLLALILAGAILYLARRTVYTDWYRGMYKRYGCDASGVTGGVTGSEFGNTTTAGGTIGGTTLGGTTTGGLSAMGTTGGGATTGGGTTSGGTSTMGTTSGTSAGDMVTM